MRSRPPSSSGKKTVRGDNGRQTIAYTVASKNPLVTILFLSDGKQTRGSLQPLEGAQRGESGGHSRLHRRARYAARRADPAVRRLRRRQGRPPRIPVPPDPATLNAIAKVTGGKFFDARSAEALQSAYKELGSKLGRVPGNKEITNEPSRSPRSCSSRPASLGALGATPAVEA